MRTHVSLKKIILALGLAAAAFVASCNTVEGAGRDVKAAGRGIESGADNAKP
jgi:predicted small secreted protein